MFMLPRYKDAISLIPGGCPQFLDFEAVCPGLRRVFEEERLQEGAETKVHLHAFRKDEDGDLVDVLDPSRKTRGNEYTINEEKALEPWLERWLPIPFLRTREQKWEDGESRFEYGPTNWARAWISRRPGAAEGEAPSIRVVLAFDMQVEKRQDDAYAALSPQDVDANAHFRLAWRFRDNAWFLNEGWVNAWLRELWDDWQRRQKRRRSEDAPELEHLARYLAALDALNQLIQGREVYVINPARQRPVEVDLVLDIGNSRTTGILVETQAQQATNLNNGYLLQLRDLDRPDHIYTDPFETRVEFSEASFGNDALSRRAGRRTSAFAWPSPVRIGPEAARLSTFSRCAAGTTGMSSPKRYLWDERNWVQSWRFNTQGKGGDPYVTRGPLAQLINSSGTPLCYVGKKSFRGNKSLRNDDQAQFSAFESLFTRSSLMMFLLVEILHQALLTINSPGQRIQKGSPDVPRRLRQVIFTVPAGMPIAEQKIYRSWTEGAVRVLWDALGWQDFYHEERKSGPAERGSDYRDSPQVRCNWDEATCTQLVYIYNEITRKFRGDAQMFCSLAGRLRPEYGGRPGVRVAAIDIGGGTTDLSITTFTLDSDEGSSPRIGPHPEFHDGFNIAGDDVLQAVVRNHVLTALADALGAAGLPNPREAVLKLFGKDDMNSSEEDRNQRIQFIRQVAVPVALTVLSLYEKADLRAGSGSTSFRFGDVFRSLPPAEAASSGAAETGQEGAQPGKTLEEWPAPGENALKYITEYVRSRGCEDFDVLETPIRVDPRRVDETVRTVLGDVLANLCEVIQRYDCDALLLTGRPSRWQGVVDTVYSLLPVPPDRILPMGEYRIKGWYPFADALGRMSDPKTTVVVGAILCALAEGQLEGFSFDTAPLTLASTARYIGEMENDGQIKTPKVWFTMSPEKGKPELKQHTIQFGGPIAVGFRQLEAERWTTTRFYVLEFASEDMHRKFKSRLPFTLDVSYRSGEGDADAEGKENVQDEGEIRIEKIGLSNPPDEIAGDDKKAPLQFRLQTLPLNEGFWLDTGIIYA